MAGENNETPKLIMINGEEEIYTGTRHRVLLFKVYAEALRDAGLFGWGQQMKGIDLEDEIAERFGSIDSHYVLFFLQRGHSGLWPFVLLQVVTLVQLGRAAWPGKGLRAGLAGSMFGAMAAVDVGLFSVWFSPDFGTVWLFTAGVAANLAALGPEAITPPGRHRRCLRPPSPDSISPPATRLSEFPREKLRPRGGRPGFPGV